MEGITLITPEQFNDLIRTIEAFNMSLLVTMFGLMVSVLAHAAITKY